jgi:hypothetical protein
MGHRTLNMTNEYASLNVEQIQETHDQHSPLRYTGSRSTDFDGLGTGYWEVEWFFQHGCSMKLTEYIKSLAKNPLLRGGLRGLG